MNKKEVRDWIVFENHGQKLFGILHKPAGKLHAPIVVMCHGFGGNKAGRFRYYVLLAEKLAEQGIASLRFDFRGSGDSEGNSSEMTLKGQIEDLHKAIDFIRDDPSIDPTRIGILGRSLGGAVAIKTVCQRNDIKSIALWVPLFSSQKWKEKWGKMQALAEGEKTELRYFNGHMPNKEFLLQFFSLDLREDLQKLSHIPIMHAQGGKDLIIDGNHTQQYALNREHAEAETEMLFYPNQDHDLCNIEELQKMIRDTAEWFKKTL